MAGYAHPDVLVETDWVEVHHGDPVVRLVEADEDPKLYDEGHIPRALRLHWKEDLQDPVVRDWVDRERFARLLGDRGVSHDHTVILYGDRNNWFATYVFWLFKYYGHRDVRVLNGGRDRWLRDGRALTAEVPRFSPTEYRAGGPDLSIRTFRDDLLRSLGHPGVALVDVRSPAEFSGDLLAPPAYPQEGAQRGGHIPGARNIPWGENVREDGRFKAPEELRALYEAHGIRPEQEVVAYCRIGERSSLTWFTLKYLLGYERVKNYDGSWTEWGSLVGAPIER
ncbi:MAG: sulfurtransferase [Armatimonadota bacterium]|nr:sulfurtransferase [Armatimonadota bacterium]